MESRRYTAGPGELASDPQQLALAERVKEVKFEASRGRLHRATIVELIDDLLQRVIELEDAL